MCKGNFPDQLISGVLRLEATSFMRPKCIKDILVLVLLFRQVSKIGVRICRDLLTPAKML